MLFDLRGRGRRRTIKAIYLSLALLMGGGLVLFGIGGDVQGGLFDAFRENQNQGNDVFEERVEKTEQRVRANPRDAAAWGELARLRYQVAGQGENFDENRGLFTDKGKAELRGVEQAWNRYLELKPENPDPNIATLMVQAFGPAGLNKLDRAVNAMEFVVEGREDPTAGLYAQLATLAYAAGQTRKGDLAADKALELAPKDDREAIKGQLEAAKAQGAQALTQGAQPGAG